MVDGLVPQRVLDRVAKLTAFLSVCFGHILFEVLIDLFGGPAVNLHPSLLPGGRRANTTVWPSLDHLPAGVKAHRKLELAAFDLLDAEWSKGVRDRWPGEHQAGPRSLHRSAELASLSTVDVGHKGRAGKLFDLLRARTFPPQEGLILRVDGELVEARTASGKRCRSGR